MDELQQRSAGRDRIWRIATSVLLDNAWRAATMVIYAWEALRLTGDPGMVGWVLLPGQLLAVLVGPLVGVRIDRELPMRTLIVGEFIAIAGVALYASSTTLFPTAGLVLAHLLGSLAQLVSAPSLHRLVQAASEPATATRNASRAATASSVGFVIGAGVGGTVLARFGPSAAVLFSASLPALCIALCARAPERQRTGKSAARAAASQEFRTGWVYLLNSGELRLVAMVGVLNFAIFNLTTVLLPSLARFALGLQADRFGLLRATWSAGAIAGAGAASLWRFKQPVRPALAARWLALLGLLTVVLSATDGFAAPALTILALGSVFAINRSLTDGLIMTLCDPSVLGRVRSNIVAAVNLSSVAIFYLSTFVGADAARRPFAIAGTAIAFAGVALGAARFVGHAGVERLPSRGR